MRQSKLKALIYIALGIACCIVGVSGGYLPLKPTAIILPPLALLGIGLVAIAFGVTTVIRLIRTDNTAPIQQVSARAETIQNALNNSTQGARRYDESDNMGTRHTSASGVDALWMVRNSNQSFPPYILCCFPTREYAEEALLTDEAFQVAEDSKEIISLKTLEYGVYPADEGWELLVYGWDLDKSQVDTIKACMSDKYGTIKNEQVPDENKAQPEVLSDLEADVGGVTFEREEQKVQMGQKMTYRIYSASSMAAAQQFLQQQKIDGPLLYFVVETPEGNYCKDSQGLYKE